MNSRIKYLRYSYKMTQRELAEYLDVSRSSVNAWELELSKPSITEIILMSNLFHVSTDYFINPNAKESILVSNLTEEQRQVLKNLIECYTDQ